MWLELIGLPGVGKTTLIKRYLCQIRCNYKILRSHNPTIYHGISARFLYLLFYNKIITDENLAKKIAYRESFRLFVSRKNKVFFYDSGLLQVLVEYFIEQEEADLSMLGSLMQKISLPDKVVIITDDIEKICDREFNRQPRRFNIDKENLFQRYKSAQIFIETFLIPRIPNIEIVKVDDKNSNVFIT